MSEAPLSVSAKEVALINLALLVDVHFWDIEMSNSTELAMIAKLASNRGFSLDGKGKVVLPEGVIVREAGVVWRYDGTTR